MQIGMIGFWRMSADMVRRLLHSGHECVVFDMKTEAVETLEQEGATGARSLEDFVARLLKDAGRISLPLKRAYLLTYSGGD